ncbi:hypothetical protein [Streptomyces sp. NPDC051016]|uniref:hypothetical protein n=1 Tax=Streptomyces sp. NPDC051016 TaxID=3365638 RepID=UPI003788FF41
MSATSMAAVAAAAAAVIGLFSHMPSRWFFGLLTLASLLVGLDAALRGLGDNWVLLSLVTAAGLAGAALHDVCTAGRRRRTP